MSDADIVREALEAAHTFASSATLLGRDEFLEVFFQPASLAALARLTAENERLKAGLDGTLRDFATLQADNALVSPLLIEQEMERRWVESKRWHGEADLLQSQLTETREENERLNGVIDRVLPERTRYQEALEQAKGLLSQLEYDELGIPQSWPLERSVEVALQESPSTGETSP